MEKNKGDIMTNLFLNLHVLELSFLSLLHFLVTPYLHMYKVSDSL